VAVDVWYLLGVFLARVLEVDHDLRPTLRLHTAHTNKHRQSLNGRHTPCTYLSVLITMIRVMICGSS
jgi:hypothetical protein